MRRAFLRTLGIALVYLVSSAHVGSPDTWFEGNAGPYHLTVQVQPAGVVPGVAIVNVRANGDIPESVTIQANRFDATGAAPPPGSTLLADLAKAAPTLLERRKPDRTSTGRASNCRSRLSFAHDRWRMARSCFSTST